MRNEAEDLVTKLWNLVKTVSENPGLPHLSTRREQFKAISGAIDQLHSKNVAVPDDLHGLKKSLTDDIEKAVGDEVVLRFVQKELSQMLAEIEKSIDRPVQTSSDGLGESSIVT